MTDTRTHVDVSIPIPVQTLRDLLCTAVEGGSGYWADFERPERTTDGDYISIRVHERESHSNDVKAYRGRIKAEDLAMGLARLAAVAADEQRSAAFPAAGKHFADALDNHDATTADVVLQMTAFGELIYG
jgi:hypothetical protein